VWRQEQLRVAEDTARNLRKIDSFLSNDCSSEPPNYFKFSHNRVVGLPLILTLPPLSLLTLYLIRAGVAGVAPLSTLSTKEPSLVIIISNISKVPNINGSSILFQLYIT
jgi:hypothetical protein